MAWWHWALITWAGSASATVLWLEFALSIRAERLEALSAAVDELTREDA